ncbi:MAG TPA: hypothetical protein VGY66_03850 [Gemmataceae bacterium]|jgi:hypothetical protein|nr:hypothetical protein [Gemmataceae bacterium]
MPFTPRTGPDEEKVRSGNVAKPAAKTQMRGYYHPKSGDGRNPCPDRRDRICTSDPTPIKHRKVG